MKFLNILSEYLTFLEYIIFLIFLDNRRQNLIFSSGCPDPSLWYRLRFDRAVEFVGCSGSRFNHALVSEMHFLNSLNSLFLDHLLLY